MFRVLSVLAFFGRLEKYNIKIASQENIKFLTKVLITHSWSLVAPFTILAIPGLLCISLFRHAYAHLTRFLLS